MVEYNLNVRDFILVVGRIDKFQAPERFESKPLNSELTLAYQTGHSINNWSVKIKNGKVEIRNKNPFLHVFHYNEESQCIITPNYEHILNSVSFLTINQDGLREFALYHTPLGNNTFHREVCRLQGVRKIIAQDNQIKFDRYVPENHIRILQDTFIKRTADYMLQLKENSNAILLSGGSESRINAAATEAFHIKKDFITWGHPEDKEHLIANRIAKKLNTKHINIRPDVTTLPYEEILLKSGYMANMQYAYRYSVMKTLFKNYNYDAIWTGWGDINGYPSTSQSSELFSDYYLGLYRGEEVFPNGWNRDWLNEYHGKEHLVIDKIKKDPGLQIFFDLKRDLFAPTIFGQVLSMENTLGPVISPWFHPEIYQAIRNEEIRNPKLIAHKLWRTLWKNDLYYKLVKEYCPSLNYIINAKGYYPYLMNKKLVFPGLFIAGIMKKLKSSRSFPFDPVKDKKYLLKELERLESLNYELFIKKDIQNIIKNHQTWKGTDIFEIFKIIQISWFLTKHESINSMQYQ